MIEWRILVQFRIIRRKITASNGSQKWQPIKIYLIQECFPWWQCHINHPHRPPSLYSRFPFPYLTSYLNCMSRRWTTACGNGVRLYNEVIRTSVLSTLSYLCIKIKPTVLTFKNLNNYDYWMIFFKTAKKFVRSTIKICQDAFTWNLARKCK